MFYKKAEAMGDMETAEQIFNAERAGLAKKIGDSVLWDTKKNEKPWRQFAYDTLKLGNGFKYDHNPDLRTALFKSAPASLVEASPRDYYWGVGLAADDPDIHDASKWKGQNVFGLLLTKLRDEMMGHLQFTQEVAAILKARKETGRKRSLEITSPPKIKRSTSN